MCLFVSERLVAKALLWIKWDDLFAFGVSWMRLDIVNYFKVYATERRNCIRLHARQYSSQLRIFN